MKIYVYSPQYTQSIIVATSRQEADEIYKLKYPSSYPSKFDFIDVREYEICSGFVCEHIDRF